MINNHTIAVILPAYNEEHFIDKTILNVPKYVDFIIPVNDASTDGTGKQIKSLAQKDIKIHPLTNKTNHGVGFTVKRGIKAALKLQADYLVIAAGDNQCDLKLIKSFVQNCEFYDVEICRGNRFLNFNQIDQMPKLRRLGNSIYSFLTKFVSGYYSLFDFQSSYSAIRKEVFQKMDLKRLRNDYLFDNSLWINCNLVNARIKEISIPVIYGEEISNINYSRFISRSIPNLIEAWAHRIFIKYLMILHPLGLFLIAGSLLFTWGIFFGIYVTLNTLGPKTASTATVMLSVVPFILGFQLLLQAIVLDIQNEPK